jgi:ankyrin repeat protein
MKSINSLFINAARDGNLDLIVDMLYAGAEINARDHMKWTALMWASFNGHDDIVEYLLENSKLDINATTTVSHGWTALMLAVQNNHVKIVQDLLYLNADVNIATKDGWTALMIAASYGHIDIVRLLVHDGADINAVNCFGWTALVIASDNGFDDIVEILKEKPLLNFQSIFTNVKSLDSPGPTKSYTIKVPIGFKIQLRYDPSVTAITIDQTRL